MGVFPEYDGSGRNGGGSQGPEAPKNRHSRPAPQRAGTQRSSLFNQRQNARRGRAASGAIGPTRPDAPVERQRFANSSRGFAGSQVSSDRARRQSGTRASTGQRN